jgi:hypothetical protein
MLSVLPKRVNDLNDTDEPNVMKSNTLKDDPSLTMPKHDSVLPRHPILRKLSALPR